VCDPLAAHRPTCMRYLALCCDYDGTIAHHGVVDPQTIASLERVAASGRKLILVTGRVLPELQEIFPPLELFDCVVAENGALLYWPRSRKEETLGQPPDESFLAALHAAGVSPLGRGKVIVATWEPHQTVVLETIRNQGLEHQVIFNKGAVMVLPAGINKAAGLERALQALGLSPHNAVGVGDAENDHAFLGLCECAVAVSNALPTLKEQADVVTAGDHGAGVQELITALLDDDLSRYNGRLERHHLLLGTAADGSEVRVPPYGINLLLVGTSGSGKSTLATGFFERLIEQEYTFCVIDPEGDYHGLAGGVTLGTPERAPSLDEVLQLLRQPEQSCVADLVALPLDRRPEFGIGLIGRLLELRAATGRPHWIILDEAHHLLPAARSPTAIAPPATLRNAFLITVHPDLVGAETLSQMSGIIAVGATPDDMIHEFCSALGIAPPASSPAGGALEPGEALVWFRDANRAPVRIRTTPSRQERRRHARKYAEGELPEDRSFYFRGPDGKLNLRVQNLILFLQIGDGVDDETWTYHLRKGDYSAWIKGAIKDADLAARVREIEATTPSPGESRRLIREAIEERYTIPAGEEAEEGQG
jgi:hydroxymethylpyrimidine pyrophosphatase-like HAD family hydrolase